jgi:flagellar basal-body rod protein FlgC
MGAFDMLRIAGSSMGMHQTWLDALANNIANVNTVTSTSQNAFQAQYVEASARPDGRLENDPDSPLADANGNVRTPDIDLASQMTELVMAQRGYQASVQVTKDAQETYESALSIGRS